jgi:hypothetical protein
MSETARFQETLRRLAIVDEAFVGNQAGLGLHPAGTLALDTKTISLLQLAVLVATGSPGICLEWSTASVRWSAPLPTWQPRSGPTSVPRRSKG